MIIINTRSASSEATTVWASTATIAAQRIFLSGRWVLFPVVISQHALQGENRHWTFFHLFRNCKTRLLPSTKGRHRPVQRLLNNLLHASSNILGKRLANTAPSSAHISLWAGEYRFLGQRRGVSSCADQPWRGQPQYRPQDDDDGGSDDNEYVGMLDRKSVSFMLKSIFYPFWKWGCWWWSGWWLWFIRWKRCWACTRSTRCLSEASLAR